MAFLVTWAKPIPSSEKSFSYPNPIGLASLVAVKALEQIKLLFQTILALAFLPLYPIAPGRYSDLTGYLKPSPPQKDSSFNPLQMLIDHRKTLAVAALGLTALGIAYSFMGTSAPEIAEQALNQQPNTTTAVVSMLASALIPQANSTSPSENAIPSAEMINQADAYVPIAMASLGFLGAGCLAVWLLSSLKKGIEADQANPAPKLELNPEEAEEANQALTQLNEGGNAPTAALSSESLQSSEEARPTGEPDQPLAAALSPFAPPHGSDQLPPPVPDKRRGDSIEERLGGIEKAAASMQKHDARQKRRIRKLEGLEEKAKTAPITDVKPKGQPLQQVQLGVPSLNPLQTLIDHQKTLAVTALSLAVFRIAYSFQAAEEPSLTSVIHTITKVTSEYFPLSTWLAPVANSTIPSAKVIDQVDASVPIAMISLALLSGCLAIFLLKKDGFSRVADRGFGDGNFLLGANADLKAKLEANGKLVKRVENLRRKAEPPKNEHVYWVVKNWGKRATARVYNFITDRQQHTKSFRELANRFRGSIEYYLFGEEQESTLKPDPSKAAEKKLKRTSKAQPAQDPNNNARKKERPPLPPSFTDPENPFGALANLNDDE